jgi:hypothetical protein
MASQKIDPKHYFSTWHFDIHDALWPALGVERREYVDREKSRLMREKAKAEGTPKEVLARMKSVYYAYAIDEPPQYQMEEGDLFYAKQSPISIQIGKISDDIEVWVRGNGATYACWLQDNELAGWLRNGIEPKNKRIDRFQSRSEIAKFYVLSPSASEKGG